VFENRVLRRIFGPKIKELPGGWSGLYDEDLYNLHSATSIIRMIKSRSMKWVEHVARMADEEYV
jgi:hypothetical protein